jgi:hypothetical protein
MQTSVWPHAVSMVGLDEDKYITRRCLVSSIHQLIRHIFTESIISSTIIKIS